MCLLCASVLLDDASSTKGLEHIIVFFFVFFYTHKQFKEPFQCAHKMENQQFHDSIRLSRVQRALAHK